VSINREREDVKLRVRRRLEYRDALKKERDALERERRRLQDQCEDSQHSHDNLNFEKSRLKDIVNEVKRLVAKAERTLALKKERDVLKGETGKLQTQCKENALLEQKLNALTVRRERRARERDDYIREAERVERDIDALEKEIDAQKKKIQKLRVQCKETSRLHKQINTLGIRYKKIKRNRNALISKLQEIGEDEEAITMDRDRLKLEVEELRDLRAASTQLRKQISDVRTHCVQVNRDRDALELKFRRRVERREAFLKERDALERERRSLRSRCPDNDMVHDALEVEGTALKDMGKETNKLILKAETVEALKKDRDALRSEIEDLRTQSKDNALLEEQLNTLTLQLEKSATERDGYIHEAQYVEDDIDDIEEENYAIETEIENLRAQFEDCALLEANINTLRSQYHKIKGNRNALHFKLQGMGENEEAIRMDRDRLKLEVEELRDVCGVGTELRMHISDVSTQCVQVNRDRDALELEFLRRVERREALLKERDALVRERQHLKPQC
jgi:chromosome segregation ATPase